MIPKRSTTRVSPALPLPAALGGFVAGALLMVAAAPVLFGSLGMRGGLVVSELLLVLPLVLASAASGLRSADILGPNRPTSRQWILVVLLVAPLWLGAGGVLMLQQTLVPLPPEVLEQFRALHAALRPKNALDALLAVTAIAVVPAVAEEILVRGVLLPSLGRSMPQALALLLSAAAFALLHLDGHRWAFTFLLGLVLGWLRLRSGTLLVPIAVHAAFNAITYLVAPYLDDGAEPVQVGAGVLLFASGLTLGIPLARALHRSFGKATLESAS